VPRLLRVSAAVSWRLLVVVGAVAVTGRMNTKPVNDCSALPRSAVIVT